MYSYKTTMNISKDIFKHKGMFLYFLLPFPASFLSLGLTPNQLMFYLFMSLFLCFPHYKCKLHKGFRSIWFTAIFFQSLEWYVSQRNALFPDILGSPCLLCCLKNFPYPHWPLPNTVLYPSELLLIH